MEYAKNISPNSSINDEILDKDIQEYIELQKIKINEERMGLTGYQIKNLADSSKRRQIFEEMKKNLRLIIPDNQPSSHNQEKISSANMFKTLSNNEKIFYVPSEISSFSNEKFHFLKLSAWCNCVLGIVCIGCSGILYDLEYNSTRCDKNYNDWLQISIFNTICNILLIGSIFWRKVCELDWKKAKNFYSKYDGLRSSNLLSSLIVEIWVNLVHPVWFLKDYKLNYYNDVYEVTVSYSYNSILSMLSVVKLIHLLRLLLLESRYSTERAQRVGKMNGISVNNLWTLKCMMITSPFKVVTFMLLIGLFVGGFCLRIFERGLINQNNIISEGFVDYGTAMWCILITMTTVGFGETLPVSIPGRMIGVIACIWGIFVVSLMVVGINLMLKFDSGQEKSFTLHQRLDFKTFLKKVAVMVLSSAFKFKRIIRKNFDNDKEVSRNRSNYKRSIIAFQKAKSHSNIIYDVFAPEKKIEQKINSILDIAKAKFEKAKKNYENLEKIKEIYIKKNL